MLSIVEITTSLDPTISSDAGILAGDLLIVIARAVNVATTVPPAFTPPGFTNITQGGLVNVRVAHAFKIAAGGESAIPVATGTRGQRSALLVVRSNVPFTSGAAVSVAQQTTAGDPAPQHCAADVPPSIVVASFINSGVPISPITFTPAPDALVSFVDFFVVGAKLSSSAAQSVTVDMPAASASMHDLTSYGILLR